MRRGQRRGPHLTRRPQPTDQVSDVSVRQRPLERRQRHTDIADETRRRTGRVRCTDLRGNVQDRTYKRYPRACDQRRLGTFGISKRSEPVVERVGDGLRELDALARPDARPRSVARPLGDGIGDVGEPSSGVLRGKLVCSTRLRKSRRLRAAGLDAAGAGAGAGVG